MLLSNVLRLHVVSFPTFLCYIYKRGLIYNLIELAWAQLVKDDNVENSHFSYSAKIFGVL